MKGNSRWDGLREDRTNSATLSARRRIISRSEGLRHPYHEERNVSAPCDNYFNTTKGDWRKQPNPKNAISLTGEDKKVRLAIQSLKASVAAYVNAFDSSSTKCRHEQAIEKSVNEISLLVFGVADLPGLRKQTNYTSQRQTVITNSVLWNGTESTFNHLKQLRQSSSCELVLKLSYITAAFLQLIKDDIEQSSVANDTAGEFQRPRSMTDLRLCECASILLDFLAGNIHRQGEDVTLLNDCKSALFECLANLLALSALLGYCDCDARNRRRLLFPWGAEKTVDLIVTNSVLPFVNAVMEDGSISISSKCAYCHPAIECLTKLLLNDHLKGSHPRNKQPSNHAAAIMAPLIVDVDQNGEENQKPNPLRSSTLKAITSFWNLAYQLTEMGHTDAIIDYTILACQSLKAALDSLHAFKGGNMHNSGNETPPIEIDVVALCRQIQNALQNVPLTGNQIIFLQLLASLCHSYPSAAARQWHLFLEQPAPYSGGKESSKNAPIFLGYIVDATLVLNERKLQSSSTKMLPDALHTTLMMVSAMPLSYWIMDGSKSKQKISGETYFTSRVQNSILRLIDCTYSLMQTIRDIISGIPHLSNKVIGSIPLLNSIISHTSKLAAMLCSSLPFNDPNAPLLHSASKLVGYSGEIFVSCVKMMGNVTSEYLELVEMAADTFSRVIIDTVDINSTQSISPSQYWLSDCSSYEFLDILLSGGQEIVERKQVVILSQIARICPSAFTREPFNLASFCELCSIQYYDHDLRRKLSGVKLIESFLIGRNVFRESESSDTCEAIVNSICPMLISALEDNEAKIREVAIASLGQLSEPEWSILLYHSRCDGLSCLGWQYVQTILRFSCKKHGENDAKVRSSACKAIGDTSTCIISMPLCTDEFVCLLSQTICHEMENVLNDKHPPVRSMVCTCTMNYIVLSEFSYSCFLLSQQSLFAIGNVAFSLKERFDSGGITLPLLSQLNTSFSSVCSCLDDKDDKVSRLSTFVSLLYRT